MKKILLAWIEQVIQFDSRKEYEDYAAGLIGKYSIISERTDAEGKVFIQIRKQYNNNQFPDNVQDSGKDA